jgi:hypothetical protein
MSNRAQLALAFAVSLLLVTGFALAQAIMTPYTATEAPLALVSPGETTQPDGNAHIRGYTLDLVRTGSDPRVTGGTLRTMMNLNLGKDFSGPIWGTSHWEIGSGVWEGTFEGSTNFVTHVGYYDAVWHGSGQFGGLQLKETCVYTGTRIGNCTGRILATPGN